MKRLCSALLLMLCLHGAARAESTVELVIQRHASLTEQVLFEADLRQLPQVQAVIPKRLNTEQRTYRLILQDANSAWLGRWLAQRGYHVRETGQGWLAN